MKNDMKTRLFSSVIFGRAPDPVYFGERPRRRWSMGGVVSTALAVAAAAGLLMLLWEKVNPLF